MEQHRCDKPVFFCFWPAVLAVPSKPLGNLAQTSELGSGPPGAHVSVQSTADKHHCFWQTMRLMHTLEHAYSPDMTVPRVFGSVLMWACTLMLVARSARTWQPERLDWWGERHSCLERASVALLGAFSLQTHTHRNSTCRIYSQKHPCFHSQQHPGTSQLVMFRPQFIDLYIYQQSLEEDPGCRQAARQNGVGTAERSRAQVAAALRLLCQVMVDGRTDSVAVHQTVCLCFLLWVKQLNLLYYLCTVLNMVVCLRSKCWACKKIHFTPASENPVKETCGWWRFHWISSRFYRSSAASTECT